MDQAIADLLDRYDPAVVARGRRYAAERRVTGLRHEPEGWRAFVQGGDRYEVTIGLVARRALDTDCTCPAYERERQCKHIVAVAVTLERRASSPASTVEDEALPAIFLGVYSSETFLSRLALHTGQIMADPSVLDRWLPLQDWWRRSKSKKTSAIVATRKRVTDHAEVIARDVEVLRTWSPLPSPRPGTVFAEIYAKLAERYVARRGDVQVRRCAPGPLEGGRHPGFDLAYDVTRSVFTARERFSPLLIVPLRFAFSLASRSEVKFEASGLETYGPADAWDMFALRAVLIALHERTEDAVLALEREFGRSPWEHVLEQLGGRAAKAPPSREWSFSIVPTYRETEFNVVAFARPLRVNANAKEGTWKKATFEALYTEEASTPALRELARVAICALMRPSEARLVLGTPQAHELLRALARHPRVVLTATPKVDLERDPPADIVVGDLVMRVAPDTSGALTPRFFVGERELPASFLGGSGSSGLQGFARGAMITSAFVPSALRPWLVAARSMGSAFAFPREAVAKLVATTEALVTSGHAMLPRSALGVELPYTPAPALRVEWQQGGIAVIEVFVSVHPAAPLVAAGRGPVLFTFEDTFEAASRRVFVERHLEREVTIAEEARTRIAAPIVWENATGHTDGLEDTLALAEYLDRNPLGLGIEVKTGKPPSVTSWHDAAATLEVHKKGSWLVLEGALDVAGIKLTLGDVLDAARLAQRYVKAADGVFLELSKEAIDSLRPVAMATELGDDGSGETRLHDAFGPILAEATALFDDVRGVDLAAITRRFEARDRRLRVPALESGTLRAYQREGVAWMLRLATWAPGCILADDMGLGKTVQTAAVLKARATLGPQLIIAPASVSSNWMSELARFVPSLSCHWYSNDRELAITTLGPGDVLVVTYGLLQRRSERFEGQRWATLVIDEAQYVKNALAQRTDAVRALERDFTIALTGTPLENHLGELFSIVDLAFPGLLGRQDAFRERFRRPIEGQRDDVRLGVLGRLLSPFLLRRTRANVLEELPAREEITEYIDLAPAEQKRYLALRSACEQQFAKRKKSETAAQLKIALFAALTRLRQLACDVRLVDPSFKGPSSKITRAVELATELAEEGNRALVFSQFTQFLGKLKTALEAAGLRVAYLAGDTPTTKRRAIVDAFQAGEYDVFCISLLAGGTGLNLTRASYVIHTDPWWNPAVEEQATSRAHRMGQTDPVTVYRLVARGTIEEAVLAMHASKKELAAAVLEGKTSTKAITSSELLELLRFGA